VPKARSKLRDAVRKEIGRNTLWRHPEEVIRSFLILSVLLLLASLAAQALGDPAKQQESTASNRTAVLFESKMGDANKHGNTNLPVILTGVGFKHGAHHASRSDSNTSLCNLFVTLLQYLGVESDRFATAQWR
jgi:hypothetical protein